MKKASLLLGLLLVVPVTAQEHAPTAAQCQADVAVWGNTDTLSEYAQAQSAFVRDGIPNRTGIAKLSWTELTGRVSEMADCSKVDPQQAVRYSTAWLLYTTVESNRVNNFMTRHDLWSQFKEEDAQGKR